VTEIVLGEDALLDHYQLQHESTQAYHIDATYAVAARGADCSFHYISLGGALVRNDVVAVLGGEGSKCAVDGLYLADRQRLVDCHTVIEHVKPRCRSSQAYEGILADEARGVIDARLMVGNDATKTAASQSNRSLLLSDNARIDSTSCVQLSANDGNCNQHSDVRQLSAEVAEARHVVTHHFTSEALNRLRLQPLSHCVREIVRRQVDRWLGGGA